MAHAATDAPASGSRTQEISDDSDSDIDDRDSDDSE